jgi:hypothetical protein
MLVGLDMAIAASPIDERDGPIPAPTFPVGVEVMDDMVDALMGALFMDIAASPVDERDGPMGLWVIPVGVDAIDDKAEVAVGTRETPADAPPGIENELDGDGTGIIVVEYGPIELPSLTLTGSCTILDGTGSSGSGKYEAPEFGVCILALSGADDECALTTLAALKMVSVSTTDDVLDWRRDTSASDLGTALSNDSGHAGVVDDGLRCTGAVVTDFR